MLIMMGGGGGGGGMAASNGGILEAPFKNHCEALTDTVSIDPRRQFPRHSKSIVAGVATFVFFY